MKNMNIKRVFFIGYLISLSACAINYITPLIEIADPNHPEIASIRKHSHNSYLVAYNPDMCKAVGDACSFFRSHAYAHFRLNHTLMRPKYYPALSENQADCYVAKYAKPEVTKAMVKLLLDKNRDPELKIYGDPKLRAQNITDCAKQAGNWISN